jgi:HAD superfamily phosphatase (TIGR01668 family)
MKALNNKSNSLWLPDYIAEDVHGINFAHLKEAGIKALFFDLDHTLLVHGELDISKNTIKLLKSQNFDLFIATNRQFSEDLDYVGKQINAKAIMHARFRHMAKPSRDYYAQAVKLSGYKAEEIAMVGDRLVQDIYGAKRAGLNAILVHKFGKIKWYDQLITIHDRLLPVIFRRCYKDI